MPHHSRRACSKGLFLTLARCRTLGAQLHRKALSFETSACYDSMVLVDSLLKGFYNMRCKSPVYFIEGAVISSRDSLTLPW